MNHKDYTCDEASHYVVSTSMEPWLVVARNVDECRQTLGQYILPNEIKKGISSYTDHNAP